MPKPKLSAAAQKERREEYAKQRDRLATIRVLLSENAEKERMLAEKNVEVEKLQESVAQYQDAIRQLTDQIARQGNHEQPECPVCHEPFVRTVAGKKTYTGKDLVCGHTICEDCLAGLLANIPNFSNRAHADRVVVLLCPVCRKGQLTKTTTANFPTNYILKNILMND